MGSFASNIVRVFKEFLLAFLGYKLGDKLGRDGGHGVDLNSRSCDYHFKRYYIKLKIV